MSADRLGHYYFSIHNLGPVCIPFPLIVRHFLLEEIFSSTTIFDGQGLHEYKGFVTWDVEIGFMELKIMLILRMRGLSQKKPMLHC